MCTSIADRLPSAWGDEVMPTAVPALMSASLAGMTARTVALSLSLSLSSAPSRDLTVTTSPATPSTVPRTRDGGGCCAKLADPASSTARLEAPNVRRVIWLMVILFNLTLFIVTLFIVTFFFKSLFIVVLPQGRRRRASGDQ